MNSKMKKWFQRDNLIIIILSGILLLVIALPTGIEGKDAGGDAGETAGGSNTGITQLSGSSTGRDDTGITLSGGYEQYGEDFLTEYEKRLESRLQAILEGMAGAGKVEVMITFSSSEELVVEKDRPMTRSNTTESDGEGGTRTIYQTDSGETTVYRSVGSDSEPYVVKTLTPKVEGVLVAAQGAGTGEVTKNITEAIQVLFDLEAHKIKVIRMKASQ